MTAAYFWRAISGDTASMVAKKFVTKDPRSEVEAELLVHIRAACVARGSERTEFRDKLRKRSKKSV